MQTGKPSRTALAAATHRAAHQLIDQGRIFSDPLAVRILGTVDSDAEAILRGSADDRERKGIRIFIAARTRFAEDSLSAAVENGVRQLVILGAGLDTFAYRHTLGDRLRIFEVDYPATQAWKRERLAEAAIPIPPSLTYAPVDFEHQTLAEGLKSAGFDRAIPTFFTWLGVVPYLTEDAIWSTLSFIAGLEAGSQVVFDYANPPESMPENARADHEKRAAKVAAAGEAFKTYFETDKLEARLKGVGFSGIEDLSPAGMADRYVPPWRGYLGEKGGHILRAWRDKAL